MKPKKLKRPLELVEDDDEQDIYDLISIRKSKKKAVTNVKPSSLKVYIPLKGSGVKQDPGDSRKVGNSSGESPKGESEIEARDSDTVSTEKEVAKKAEATQAGVTNLKADDKNSTIGGSFPKMVPRVTLMKSKTQMEEDQQSSLEYKEDDILSERVAKMNARLERWNVLKIDKSRVSKRPKHDEHEGFLQYAEKLGGDNNSSLELVDFTSESFRERISSTVQIILNGNINLGPVFQKQFGEDSFVEIHLFRLFLQSFLAGQEQYFRSPQRPLYVAILGEIHKASAHVDAEFHTKFTKTGGGGTSESKDEPTRVITKIKVPAIVKKRMGIE